MELGQEEGWAARCEPIFSVPPKSENSRFKLGLADHQEGIIEKAEGWNISYLMVY